MVPGVGYVSRGNPDGAYLSERGETMIQIDLESRIAKAESRADRAWRKYNETSTSEPRLKKELKTKWMVAENYVAFLIRQREV